MIATGDIVNVQYLFSLDGKKCEVPSLWYVWGSTVSIPINEIGLVMKYIYTQYIRNYCTDSMSFRGVLVQKLAGLQMTTRVVGGVQKFKSIREQWGERSETDGEGILGAVVGSPKPSFVAWGVTNKVSEPRILNPATGHATTTAPAIYPRSGGFRWPGFPEVYTAVGQPSRITEGPRSNMQTAIRQLLNPGAATVFDNVTPNAMLLLSMSKFSMLQPRAIREPLAEPQNWTPQWVVSQVTSLVVRPRVTSQVSRKVDPSEQ